MAGENRGSVLVVEDCEATLSAYKHVLGDRGYDVTSILYCGPQTEIPSKRFDAAVLDGLNGNWLDVANKIDSKKIAIVSGDRDIVKAAEEAGFIARRKLSTNAAKLVEMIQ